MDGPIVGLWLTGPPDAGKTTLGRLLVNELMMRTGRHAVLLDADEVRARYWPHLGHSTEDRVVNVRGLGGVAAAVAMAGSNVIVAAVSPDRDTRRAAQIAMMHGMRWCMLEEQDRVRFLEVYVWAPLDVLQSRDTKGLYRRQAAGELSGLTGVDAPYEEPRMHDDTLWLNTDMLDLGDCMREVLLRTG